MAKVKKVDSRKAAWQPEVRQAEVRAVARLLSRSGMQGVTLSLPDLRVSFRDPVANTSVRMDILPWPSEKPGQLWYACVRYSDASAAHFGEPSSSYTMRCRYPRHAVRGYWQMTEYERCLSLRKKRK